jgi:hypothetical protein
MRGIVDAAGESDACHSNDTIGTISKTWFYFARETMV